MLHDDHRPRVERAIRYIVEHLGEDILLADVARIAALSPYHFHRVFQAYTHEPVGRFISRTRLERAARMLAYERHRSITDIALACGYSSSSNSGRSPQAARVAPVASFRAVGAWLPTASTRNFAKAFSAWFGASPSRVRDASGPTSGGKLAELYGRGLDPRALYS